eukprot:9836045-Lingulodinium_polyedra.AAC.1
MGLEDIVEFIMQDERPSFMFINGFKRLEQKGESFVVQAVVISRVPEGVLAELMGDPRVAQTYPVLWKRLAEDTTLSKVVGEAPHVLKHKCIKGGQAVFQFCVRRFLEVASGLPWSLCRGDLAANL